MKINFSILIDNGTSYTRSNPGIAIADYVDFLNWQEERDENFWNKIEKHYMEQSQFSFEYETNEYTAICDLEKMAVNIIGFDWKLFKENYVRTCLLMDDEFIILEDSAILLSKIAEYYNMGTELYLYFLFSNQAGDIWVEDGVRYYMHSREAGRHSMPHIHVDYKHECGVSISLLDGNVLEGSIPGKVLKRVKQKILDNKKFLLECWNKNTDGLKVDINHYFGIVPLEV